MREIVTTITRGGQITIPAEVRRLLKVKPGEQVAYEIEDGVVRLVTPRWNIRNIAGSVKHPEGKDMATALAEAKEEMAERYLEKMRTGEA